MIRAATFCDCVKVAERARQADIQEIAAAEGQGVLASLAYGLEHSDVCLALLSPHTGEPGAILGVSASPYSHLGLIWLIGTPEIERASTTFLRQSRPVLSALYETTGYLGLYNHTHKPNTVHHKWLRWLGFVFIRELTINNEPFYEFVRLKDN